MKKKIFVISLLVSVSLLGMEQDDYINESKLTLQEQDVIKIIENKDLSGLWSLITTNGINLFTKQYFASANQCGSWKIARLLALQVLVHDFTSSGSHQENPLFRLKSGEEIYQRNIDLLRNLLPECTHITTNQSFQEFSKALNQHYRGLKGTLFKDSLEMREAIAKLVHFHDEQPQFCRSFPNIWFTQKSRQDYEEQRIAFVQSIIEEIK